MTDREQKDEPGTERPGPPEHLAGLTGMDLVRRALEEARGAARAEGKDVGRGRSSPPARRVAGAGRRRSWSGPGPDARDPQLLGAATRDLAKTRGWNPRVSEGAVFGQWPSVVGEHIAEHAIPVALRDGVLSVSAVSTAWATKLPMVQGAVARQDRGLGRRRGGDVVENHGPHGPVLAKGAATCRGPRAPRYVWLTAVQSIG